jgi:hypothetical protein
MVTRTASERFLTVPDASLQPSNPLAKLWSWYISWVSGVGTAAAAAAAAAAAMPGATACMCATRQLSASNVQHPPTLHQLQRIFMQPCNGLSFLQCTVDATVEQLPQILQ